MFRPSREEILMTLRALKILMLTLQGVASFAAMVAACVLIGAATLIEG